MAAAGRLGGAPAGVQEHAPNQANTARQREEEGGKERGVCVVLFSSWARGVCGKDRGTRKLEKKEITKDTYPLSTKHFNIYHSYCMFPPRTREKGSMRCP